MAVTSMLGFHYGRGLVCLTTLICLLMNGVTGYEKNIAHRSPRGALLCPLVDEFYSYSRRSSHGPSMWGEISECCQGLRQSPRDLSSWSPSLCGRGHPTMVSYNSTRTLPGSLYNNGHDPAIDFHGSDSAYLSNVPYRSGTYVLDNIHVHFCTEEKGSEHAIDGRFFQSEIHLVHYKESYGSLAKAVLHEDGLVVISIMLQSVDGYHSNLNEEMVKIIREMGNLQGIGKDYQLPIQVNVGRIFPHSTNFYTYDGSLSSPPCSESVRWIVFREPIIVSRHEMNILHRLPNEDRIYIAQSCNDRPLQYGYTRVETNFGCAGLSNTAED